MTLEETLKYVIWAGLAAIMFTPLIIIRDYFFPFIVPKALYFRVIVEVIFLAWLALAIIKKEYRPKLNIFIILFALYFVGVFISSLFGDNFYFSFWSNNERSEGLLLLMHLFILALIFSSMIKSLKDWLTLFDISFLSSILVSFFALKQYFEPSWKFFGNAERLSATIGNAGYVAGYLIFNIFFGILLCFLRNNKYLRWYYLAGILFQIFIVFNTLTRGGIIALVFSLAIFVAYLVFFYFRKNKIVKRSGIVILLLGVLFTGLVFGSQDADWVKSNKALNRVTNISIDSPTAKNRLMTWQSAWEGFKERPILGYGYENFYQVFDKHFNPKIYKHAGSVTWFDRAHNIVFDRLITGGIIGLLLYLAMIFVPLIFIWRAYRKKEENTNYLIPVIFTLIILAYFVQNLFIFEALVTYIPLFLVLSFLGNFSPSWGDKFSQSKKPYLVLLTIGVVVFFPILFSVNVKPVQANKLLVEGIILRNSNRPLEAYDKYIEAIEMETFGNAEYRQHFGEFVAAAINNEEVDRNWRSQAALRAEKEFDEQLERRSKSVRIYLMTIRFLNKSYVFDVTRLEKALTLFEEAVVLSPTRQALYTEAAYSQYFLGKFYKDQGELEKGEELFDKSLANMQKAIDLNETIAESYSNYIMILLVTGRSDQIAPYYEEMKRINEANYFFRVEDFLSRIGSSAIHAEDYQWASIIYKDLLTYIKNCEIVAENEANYHINLALAYAYLGQNDKAIETIETAREIKKFGPNFAEEVEKFIQNAIYPER